MISEELLKQAAEETEQIMLESLPAEETTHDFSSVFEHKMQKMCKQTEQSRVYIFLKRAACAVLAIVLLCGALMLNTEARASIVGWLRESFDRVDSYYATGDGTNLKGIEYRIKQFPQGFQPYAEKISVLAHNWTYIDSNGELMHFGYILDSNAGNLYIYKDGYKHTAVSVNGHQANAYISHEKGENSTIVWSNSDGVLFRLTGPFGIDELIHIAESVYSVEK